MARPSSGSTENLPMASGFRAHLEMTGFFPLRTILRATAWGILSCLPVGSIGCSTEVFSGETQWALPNEWHWNKRTSPWSNQDPSRHLKQTQKVDPPSPWRVRIPAVSLWLAVSPLVFWCVFFTRLSLVTDCFEKVSLALRPIHVE